MPMTWWSNSGIIIQDDEPGSYLINLLLTKNYWIMKKLLFVMFVAGTFLFCNYVNAERIIICKGSGEDCMTIEKKGMSMHLVKKPGSAAIVIEEE